MHAVIVGELRVSWRVTLALLIKHILYSSATTRHWSRTTRLHLFHHLIILPWAAQVSLPSPSLHHPGNWSLPATGVAVVLRLQSLWKSVGWALHRYSQGQGHRTTEPLSLGSGHEVWCLHPLTGDTGPKWRSMTLFLPGLTSPHLSPPSPLLPPLRSMESTFPAETAGRE